MSHHLLMHSWRTARVAVAALALTAAALTVSGSASTGGLSATAPVAASAAAGTPCLTGGSAQRVRADSGLAGVDPNDLTVGQTEQAESQLAQRTSQRRLSASSVPTKVTIDVYVHVIKRSSGSGGVSKSRIKKQISVLNAAYAGKSSSSSTKTIFGFKLKKTDSVKKSDWYHWSVDNVGDDDDVKAKTKLHRGGFDDLNLYLADLEDPTAPEGQQEVLGYSTFPWDTTLAEDGVVVLNRSLPGGSDQGYNKGDTAVHEVGHWLGLLHTFENGCDEPGDAVADTPNQADGLNIFSCDAVDTCPSTGKDPVHNFMSYGDDACLNRFTAGQADRMVRAWQAFRSPTSAG